MRTHAGQVKMARTNRIVLRAVKRLKHQGIEVSASRVTEVTRLHYSTCLKAMNRLGLRQSKPVAKVESIESFHRSLDGFGDPPIEVQREIAQRKAEVKRESMERRGYGH